MLEKSPSWKEYSQASALPMSNLEIFEQPLTSVGRAFLLFQRKNLDKMLSEGLPSLTRVVASKRPLKYFKIVAKE